MMEVTSRLEFVNVGHWFCVLNSGSGLREYDWASYTAYSCGFCVRMDGPAEACEARPGLWLCVQRQVIAQATERSGTQ